MNVAIILAGGVGSRVGAKKPKQFIKILGKPVIAYTLDAFEEHKEIDKIEVVCLKSHIEYLKEIIKEYDYKKVEWIVSGGKNFQESVMNGIDRLEKRVKDEDIVLVHYAASPFVTKEIITDGIRVAKKMGNSTSATPCYLLTGSNDDGLQSTKWIDRDKIMQLNAPQCFKYGYVKNLYDEAKEKDLLDKVEPHTTSLMYLMGKTIYFSKGNQTNIKITTKEDLDLFEGYILMKQKRKDINRKMEL